MLLGIIPVHNASPLHRVLFFDILFFVLKKILEQFLHILFFPNINHISKSNSKGNNGTTKKTNQPFDVDNNNKNKNNNFEKIV